MTLEEIREWVRKIKATKDDPEVAHTREDALYLDFILFVEKTTTDDVIGNLAGEVLRAADIEFERWTA